MSNLIDQLLVTKTTEDSKFYGVTGFEKLYKINRRGLIVDALSGKYIVPRMLSGYWYVDFRVNKTRLRIRWERIYLMTFDKLDVELDTYRTKLGIVVFEREVPLSLKNLAWKIPEGGIESKTYPGYFVIIGNSDIVVSKDLKFLKTEFNKEVKIIWPKCNIRYPSISNAHKDREIYPLCTSTVHRLVALAFLPLPNKKQDCYINHLDGNKLNFSVKNLEWVSLAHNSKHAIENRLRVDGRIVHAFNVDTKEIRSFVSFGECGRFLNVLPGIISLACHYFQRSRIIKLRPWIVVNDRALLPKITDIINEAFPRHGRIFFRVVGNGSVDYVYKRDGLKKNYPSVEKEIPNKLSWKEYAIGDFLISPTLPSAVPDSYLSLMPKHTHGNKPPVPIKVTNLKSGEIVEYPSTEVFSSLVGAKKKTIQRRVLYNNGVWNGFLIEYMKNKSPLLETVRK